MKYLFWHHGKGFFWFRFFYRGLSFMDRTIHKAPFSERNGYKKVLRVGKWAIGYLDVYPHMKRSRGTTAASMEGK